MAPSANMKRDTAWPRIAARRGLSQHPLGRDVTVGALGTSASAGIGAKGPENGPSYNYPSNGGATKGC